MALNLKDRVKETCAAPGTGTVTLLGPVSGYAAFSTVGTGNTTYYAIVDPVTYQWEVGTGTWTTGGSYGTLARTTVSSNSLGTTALINFSSGTQDVFITLPSQFAVTNISIANAYGFYGYVTRTNSVPELTVQATTIGLLRGTGNSLAATTIGQGLTFTTGNGTLNANSATASAVGVVYGATGNTTSNVNNTGLGFGHVLNTSVVNSTVIGNNANVSVIGTSSFTTQGGVAVGRLAKASSVNSVSIGANSSAATSDSVVIGANSTLAETGSVVIGSQAKTTNATSLAEYSTAIGHNTTVSSAAGAVVIGASGAVAGDSGIAIGYFANVTLGANTGIAIGDSAYAQNEGAISIGRSAGTSNGSYVATNAISIGVSAQSIGDGSTSIGVGTVAGNFSTAIGTYANATTPNSIVLSAQSAYPGLTAPNTGVFIDTIRDESAGSPNKTLKYNSTTKEIFYGAASSGSGTVTNVSVVTANGLGGTVATSTTTPAITLSSSVNGIVRGNGTALSAATIGSGLDYTSPTLSTVAATATVRGGLLYGATGNATSSVNNTLYGFSGVLGTSVTNATVVGTGANVSGTGSTYGSVAFGARAKSLVGDSVSVGADSKALQIGAIALGANATASYTNSIAIGVDSLTDVAAQGSIAIGWNSAANNGTSIAIGQGTGAVYDSSVIVGANSADTAANAVVVGYGSVSGNGSITIGANTYNNQPNSIALSTSGTLSPANSGVFIDSMRDESAGSPNKTLKYNTTTKEIFYGAGGGAGSVTNVSVVTANGFGGTVATSTTTPAITITTGVTGLLKGNGTAVAAATAGTDYAPATSGSAILKGNGTGGFSSAAVGTDYAPATTGTAGQILVNNGTGGFTNIANGTSGYLLTSNGSSPQWTQTLGVANGGTGLNSLTTNYIPYGNGTGALLSSSGFTFDGTTLVSPAHSLSISALTSSNTSNLNVGGSLGFSDTGIATNFVGTTNSYLQAVIQNKSNGTAASSEWIAYNDNGTSSTNFAAFGINSSGYTGTGAINAPNNGYFITGSSDLVLGTISSNAIHFVINSGATDAMTINTAGNIGLGTTSPGAKLAVVGTGYSPNITLSDTGTIAWDTSLGQVATFTFITSSRAMGAPTNLVSGGFYALAIIQNGGNNTITSWNTVFKWPGGVAPILSTAANAKDYFVFRSDGTNLYLQGQSLGVA